MRQTIDESVTQLGVNPLATEVGDIGRVLAQAIGNFGAVFGPGDRGRTAIPLNNNSIAGVFDDNIESRYFDNAFLLFFFLPDLLLYLSQLLLFLYQYL